MAQEVTPTSSRNIAARLRRSRGLGGIDLTYAGGASGSTTTTGGSGVPPAPSTSTGNDRADNFRASVHKYGAAVAVAFPEAAPFIAAGVGILDAWVAVNAAFQGESWDSDDYQAAAAAAYVEYLRRGYSPPHWYPDIEFARDYQQRMEVQLSTMTAIGDATIQVPAPYTSDDHRGGYMPDAHNAAALLDMGHAFGATKDDPEIGKWGSSGTGFPFIDNVFSAVPFESSLALDSRNYLVGPADQVLALIAAKNWSSPLSPLQDLAKQVADNFCNASSPYGRNCGDFPTQRDQDAAKLAVIWSTLADYAAAHGAGIPKTATKTATGAPVMIRAGGFIAGRGQQIASAGARVLGGTSPGQVLRRRAASQPKSTKKALVGAAATSAAVAALVVAGALL